MTFASLVLLVILQLLESFVQQPPVMVWVLRVLPLLIFVPGMVVVSEQGVPPVCPPWQ